MEEVYVVRHRHLVEGVAIRQIAREMGIDRNTVRRYIRGAPLASWFSVRLCAMPCSAA